MGEIPSRAIFDIADFKKPLYPYFLIVNCVKQGDMDKFKQLLQKYSGLFEVDKTLSQVHRLQHTVIKFGLKKINVAYSKIAISDVKAKLSLESNEETEQIIAKAIRDGVIDASIDHDN